MSAVPRHRNANHGPLDAGLRRAAAEGAEAIRHRLAAVLGEQAVEALPLLAIPTGTQGGLVTWRLQIAFDLVMDAQQKEDSAQ